MNQRSSESTDTVRQSSGRRSRFTTLFLSPTEPRLRAGWRLVLQVILQLALTTCAGVFLIATWRGPLTVDSFSLSGSQILLTAVAELFAITLSVALARHVLDHRSFSSLGVKTDMRAVRDFGVGLAITFIMMGLIFVLEISFGWLDVAALAWQSQAMILVAQNTGLFLIICLIVGWNEELMSRGYHLQTLASGLNLVWAWILSSLVFGVLHLANPHANGMAVAGIILAGLFLGYGFIRTGQLWLSIGLHTGWNFFEGVVFGFPVSGL
ncbi:MAG TPA: type II CAAX endopeptidase family protein, partial [Anaerolineales bacterium]|nr:type II CAAX endopeptidase family protein [Anaerolineales bacterium]